MEGGHLVLWRARSRRRMGSGHDDAWRQRDLPLTAVTFVTNCRVSPKQEVGSPTFSHAVERDTPAHDPVDLHGDGVVPPP